MISKIFSLLLLGVLLLFPSLSFAKSYSDVSSGYKHYLAIDSLSNEGVLQGYSDGNFHPNGTINRAEAIKTLVSARFDSAEVSNSIAWHIPLGHSYAVFPDVGINEWYASYIEYAHNNQIIQGYPDNTFKPANSINFAEGLKMILNSYNVDTKTINYYGNPKVIVSSTDWFAPYFSYVNKYNLINKDKTYHPAQQMSRGEFVEVIYRLKKVLATQEAYIDEKDVDSDEYTITIPKLSIINIPVKFADPHNEQLALDVLKDGIGHYLSAPGDEKKMVLFGHSSGYSWDQSNYKTIFRNIDRLSEGDKIYINYREKGYVYQTYNSKIIPATEDRQMLENPDNNEMLLYTCWPPNSIRERYIIYSKPIM